MRVTVAFDDADCSQGTITITPSWLGRLFGRRRRVARIRLIEYLGWRYGVDRDWIGSDLEKIVNQQRRWQEVHDVPSARLVSRRSGR